MNAVQFLGRAALAAPFIRLGYEAARQPGGRVALVDQAGIPEPELAVRLNGAAMAAGGAALALGVLPRTAAAGLSLSMAATTVVGHPFWKETEPAQRAPQRIQFLKNLGLAGALVAYAAQR
ncbi:MAG TPA: DoxX family membrane protein [Citricoccus sp.]